MKIKLAIVILLFALVGCSNQSTKNEEVSYPDSPSKFVIVEVVHGKGQPDNMRLYKVQMIDNTDLGYTKFWFADKIDKFNEGDPVEFKFRSTSQPTFDNEPALTEEEEDNNIFPEWD